MYTQGQTYKVILGGFKVGVGLGGGVSLPDGVWGEAPGTFLVIILFD